MEKMINLDCWTLLSFCDPTDHRQLPSNQTAELRGAGPGVEVQILPHHTGEGQQVLFQTL